MTEATLAIAANNISQAFKDLNLSSAMQTLQYLAIDGFYTMVNALQIAVGGILKILAKLIRFFKDICNTEYVLLNPLGSNALNFPQDKHTCVFSTL